ncbi:ig-like domain-containing protein, partial [Trichonephila clavipes]
PPQALSINDLPASNNIEVRQGDKVVLYCKAVGSKPPTRLVWYKNDNELFDGGCGSKVANVSDRGWSCHEFESSTTKDPPCKGEMHVKSVESSNVPPLVR